MPGLFAGAVEIVKNITSIPKYIDNHQKRKEKKQLSHDFFEHGKAFVKAEQYESQQQMEAAERKRSREIDAMVDNLDDDNVTAWLLHFAEQRKKHQSKPGDPVWQVAVLW